MQYHLDEEKLYRDFAVLHDIPEISFQEFMTSAFIRKELIRLGFTVQHLGETGLLACMQGENSGASIALRADMDALYFRKADGDIKPLHACGHDAHCAMVLSAGRHFAAQGISSGTLYLLFQPGEETMLGAKKILAGGLPNLDGMIGIHLRPQIEIPMGAATPALLHCASFPVTAHFHGKAAHAARPFLGTNAVSAAALAITAVDELSFDTKEDWSAKATIADSHRNQHNVIPEYCSVTFDIRSESNALGGTISETVKRIAEESAQKIGCAVTFSENPGYAPKYDPRLVGICKDAITEVLGSAEPPTHSPGSEDFHAYSVLAGIPTAYIGLGADLVPGLHSPDMQFDHTCMPIGAKILIDAVTRCFQAT